MFKFNANKKKVYEDTIKISKLYPYSSSIKISIGNSKYTPSNRYLTPVNVDVINGDCIQECIKLTPKYPSDLLLLNLANERYPAGCKLPIGTTQEEHIFRCTNAYLTLERTLYPFEINEFIYTPTLSIFKDDKYNKLKEPVIVSMLTIAALDNPQVENNKYKYVKDYYTMVNKIEAIFRHADIYEAKILILGALGCGVFNNPTDEVVTIFNDCIERYRYSFQAIYFTILETKEPFKLNIAFNKLKYKHK